MFSAWMFFSGPFVKIAGIGIAFGRFSAQKLALFLGPFSHLKTGPEKAKPDYWPSLFPGQFSNPNVDPFLGPFFGPYSKSRKFNM
jgi:hypothetical protein